MLFYDQPGYADRAVLLQTLRRTWAGWRVVWAFNGLADLLRHAGLDPEQGRVYGTRYEENLYPFGRIGRPKSVWTLVTIRDETGVRAYGLDGDAVHPWWVGANVLSMLHDDTAITTCPYIPDAGLHIDLIDRSVGLWSGNTALHDIAVEWDELWPGWELRFWQDDYQAQIIAARGAVTLPPPDLPDARDRLEHRVRARWQPFVTDADTNPGRAGRSIEELRETDWYAFVALSAAPAPADVEQALAAIRDS
jgi:hypothetical protein